jgi:hypothetical protein
MGVDISGLNPTILSERPESIDFENVTDAEREIYWEAVNKWKEENPGEYFASNWWAWRPIHMLCEIVSRKYQLRVNTNGWGENSGYGLRSPKKCEELANALEDHINTHLTEGLKEDNDRIYLCMGSWCTDEGKFLNREVDDKLQEQYPFGSVLFNGVVLEDGTVAYPSHGTSLEHLKNWIAFLRNCGGFEIY